jgi:hypothetical protein
MRKIQVGVRTSGVTSGVSGRAQNATEESRRMNKPTHLKPRRVPG